MSRPTIDPTIELIDRQQRGAELLCDPVYAHVAVGGVLIGGKPPRRVWTARKIWARLVSDYHPPHLVRGETMLAGGSFAGLSVYVSELPELEAEFDWRTDLVLTLRTDGDAAIEAWDAAQHPTAPTEAAHEASRADFAESLSAAELAKLLVPEPEPEPEG